MFGDDQSTDDAAVPMDDAVGGVEDATAPASEAPEADAAPEAAPEEETL